MFIYLKKTCFFLADTSEGLVRIVKIKTNERVLVKGFSSLVEDLSFAHLYGIIMLACIDESGSVYVYVVKEDYSSQTLAVYPIFKINGVSILYFFYNLTYQNHFLN